MHQEIRLFEYGSLLPGERDAQLLAGCHCWGPVRTALGYQLVDLGVYGTMIVGGESQVQGLLYSVSRAQCFHIDVKRQCPILFQRQLIRLENGETAESYLMTADQVRGKRRLHGGSWVDRFKPTPRSSPLGVRR